MNPSLISVSPPQPASTSPETATHFKLPSLSRLSFPDLGATSLKALDLAPAFLSLVRSPISGLGRVRRLFKEINSVDEPPRVRTIKPQSVLAGIFAGGMFYDLCGATFGRRTCEDLTAKLCASIVLLDRHLDETRMPVEQKQELAAAFFSALSKGGIPAGCRGQMRSCLLLAEEAGTFVRSTPNPAPFFEEARLLGEVVFEQLSGKGSFELAFRMTAHTAGLLALLPISTLPEFPVHLLKAIRKFGAVIQLADDVQDFERDRRDGVPTFMTTSLDPRRAASQARDYARAHAHAALGMLPPHQRDQLRALGTVMALKWDSFGWDFWLK